MKKVILALFTLSAINCLADTMELSVNLYLEAAQVVRKLHLETEAYSISEFGTVGKIEVSNEVISLSDQKLKFDMSYLGPADYCTYKVEIGVDKVPVVKLNKCAE